MSVGGIKIVVLFVEIESKKVVAKGITKFGFERDTVVSVGVIATITVLVGVESKRVCSPAEDVTEGTSELGLILNEDVWRMITVMCNQSVDVSTVTHQLW